MAQDVTSGPAAGTPPEVEAAPNGHPASGTGMDSRGTATTATVPEVEAAPGQETEPLPAVELEEPPRVVSPKAPAPSRRDVRELREPTRGVRKGVKAMLARLLRLPVGPTPEQIAGIVREGT